MNTDFTAPSVSTAVPAPVEVWLKKLRKQGILVQYAEPKPANTVDIGLSKFSSGFPFQLGQLAAMLERLLPNTCSLTVIEFGSQHPTLGHKCSISLTLHCLPTLVNSHE
ncbi:hypothetical protein ANRL4_03401 [Anaerolineae bacterium]|nr:hypothetical protein ANRL4_03401 [Anaerolineae bacterium]